MDGCGLVYLILNPLCVSERNESVVESFLEQVIGSEFDHFLYFRIENSGVLRIKFEGVHGFFQNSH